MIGTMSEQDLAICREVHAGLTSKERNSINYIFLEPVNPDFVPDYPKIIKKPMDLRTLSQNLEKGTYADRGEFYADAQRIFDNALLFNKDRAESGWVLDLAKRMAKALERCRKSAEKKAVRLAGESLPEVKIASPESKEGEKKKKIKLNLKRTKSQASVAESSATSDGEEAKPPPKKKAKLKLKLSKGSSEGKKGGGTYSPGTSDEVPMTAARRAQCYKILSSLKRRQPGTCKWFHKPVSDPAIVKDYREKIQNPMDLSSITSKLDKKEHKTVGQFVLDLRRISANCLQYNHTVKDSFRPMTAEFLSVAEDLCKFFLAKNEAKVAYPSLLYCWPDCLKTINALVNMTNPEDGFQTAHFFFYPVSFYCGGVWPDGYLEKVKQPIDLGTIVQNLLTGEYKSPDEFADDCRRVVENCKTFYADDPDGPVFIDKANRMGESIEKSVGPILSDDSTEKGAKAREKAASRMITIKRPEKEFLKDVLRELRSAKYTDKVSKLTEPATLHFEKPVDTKLFTDYGKYVDNPMDLQKIDRKIASGAYATPEDFEYDIALIFRNCEYYNGPKKNLHMVALGKHTAKIFRKLFAERLRGGSGGGAKRPPLPSAGGKTAGKVGGKKRPSSPGADDRATKRVSIKGPSRTLSSRSLSSSSPPKSSGMRIKLSTPKVVRTGNEALSLPAGIASIKESYPGRRFEKDLEGWETGCFSLLKQLLRHSWLQKERAKYIYHVPVHYMFPTLREAYAEKIKQPMDLTTVEMKLLTAAYKDADEFISDIALVFANAIAFNKDGHDAGDAMSCAYYDASTHLLRYVRWLSLEVLQPYLSDSSKGPVVESGPASKWKLTIRNREFARKELESIVFNHPLDKTDPDDRYSWSEAECEKLLRSLMQTSDRKRMNWYIGMQFPPDYTAFISRPIAYDFCQEKLKSRQYNTIGEVVEDLRLIFSNALKYNEKGWQLDNAISSAAYNDAIHMSGKLEAAIDKMLLFVGDRIDRERIDMIVSQREIEAKERAEEEEMKKKWEMENPGATMEVHTRLRIVNRGGSFRKRRTDFDFPFYDEGEEQAESQAASLQHAKRLYENQREARARLTELSLSIATRVFRQHKEAAAAKEWAINLARKMHQERVRAEEEKAAAAKKEEDEAEMEAPQIDRGAFVSSALNDKSRAQIKMSMSLQKQKKKRRGLTSL